MAKKLIVLAGPDEGRVFAISSAEALLLGRSRATQTQLIDPHIARVHCQLQMDNDRVVVSDFDSPGGTWVNGQRITDKAELHAGDLLRIGNTRLQYLDDEAESEGLIDLDGAAKTLVKSKRLPPPYPRGLVGKKLAKYQIGSILGKGHNGYVFHARDTQKNLDVALKILEPSIAKDRAAVQRFVKAMKSVLPLRHPHLVRVFAAGKRGPYCWEAMEYVRGESLAAVIGRIATSGPIDWRHAVRFAVYISRALEYAHKKRLLHRNITPHNILLGAHPLSTKLTDLMLATALEGELGKDIVGRAELVGEVPYMSPERTAPVGAPVDGRTDIYSLGATLYALLAGKPPFEGQTVTEVVTRIRRQEPAPLSILHPGIPEYLAGVIRKMMAKKPADRYASAGQLRAELESFGKSQNVEY